MLCKQSLLQKRNVLVEKLLLQILRPGRDDDALARTNHWQKVSECFSRTSARLDDQVALFFKRLLDRLCHLQLSAAEFVCGMRTRQHSSGREELVERQPPCRQEQARFEGRGGHRVSIIRVPTAGSDEVNMVTAAFGCPIDSKSRKRCKSAIRTDIANNLNC